MNSVQSESQPQNDSPSPSAALAAFVKTPELSPVKTRLAAQIGDDAARTVYERAVAATESVMRASPEWVKKHWAVGEQAGVESPRWRGFPAMFTGGGELGERLANVYNAMREAGTVAILIGSDSPQLPPSFVESAARSAFENRNSAVVGPAADGGFYLFASAAAIPKTVWTSPRYSSPETLSDLESRLPVSEVIRLPVLSDLDDLPSLRVAAKELQDAPLPEQRELALWLAGRFAL